MRWDRGPVDQDGGRQADAHLLHFQSDACWNLRHRRVCGRRAGELLWPESLDQRERDHRAAVPIRESTDVPAGRGAHENAASGALGLRDLALARGDART